MMQPTVCAMLDSSAATWVSEARSTITVGTPRLSTTSMNMHTEVTRPAVVPSDDRSSSCVISGSSTDRLVKISLRFTASNTTAPPSSSSATRFEWGARTDLVGGSGSVVPGRHGP